VFRNAVDRIPTVSRPRFLFSWMLSTPAAKRGRSYLSAGFSLFTADLFIYFSPGPAPIVSNCSCCLFTLTAASSSSSKLEVRGCSLPPEIANGRYQILPMRRSFSSSSFSPLSSRIQHWNNLQMSSNGSLTPTTSPVVVPVYSSALYSCYRGFLSGGSSLISCSPGGWWQPTHNAPRCLPFGSSSSASSGGIHHSHGTLPTAAPSSSDCIVYFCFCVWRRTGRPHINGNFGNEF